MGEVGVTRFLPVVTAGFADAQVEIALPDVGGLGEGDRVVLELEGARWVAQVRSSQLDTPYDGHSGTVRLDLLSPTGTSEVRW